MSEPRRPEEEPRGEAPEVVAGGPAGGDPAAGGLGDLLGGLDLGGLLGAAQQVQAQMAEAQQRLAATTVEGQAGGGVVRIEASGEGEFRSVSIDADAIDPDDPSMLEDLVLAALHDVGARLEALRAEATPLGDLDLGGLGGMLGGA